ncbi:M23 family metallopeptidase [Desulfoscipio gibsoniae]|uniref:Membrane-bound metallopeptidase n=1 Tax=Desulfoscipio gibsoniae DSM 7213 TaxID=767817 RepID=R4KM65_9FIRM|nr:M23 family metallopeptidase [Desulfoscipio gibsoniae]AGL02642.1 membrane-bound metallopeptidase [Desulfoscipio gibsoniae DSM 7213]
MEISKNNSVRRVVNKDFNWYGSVGVNSGLEGVEVLARVENIGYKLVIFVHYSKYTYGKPAGIDLGSEMVEGGKTLKWDRLSRLSGRKKNGFDEWADYYQSVKGRQPVAPSYKRPSRRSGLFRISAVLVILVVLMAVRHYPHPATEQARENLKHLLTAEWDVRPVLDKSIQLAAQLVNWDNPVIHGPGTGIDAQPVAGDGLANEELSLPVSGKVVGQFGWTKSSVDDMERYHAGIDISAPPGASVVAALAGRVERIGEDKELGPYILINHGHGTYTLYGCVADIAVVEGQDVQAGQEIALIGENGDVQGGGLHFELRENGKLVDPLDRLSINGE